MGQLLGLSSITDGCIGHEYFTFEATDAAGLFAGAFPQPDKIIAGPETITIRKHAVK